MAPRSRLNEQRAAADPAQSVWVTANAGSGKTSVLVDRIIRLLLEGAAPARLLCLTYTRPAAAEMVNRLNETLGKWVAMPEEALAQELRSLQNALPTDEQLIRARQLFARTLETPGGLRIQTIHAFCEALLGRFPLEAQVPAKFRVLDDHGAAEMARDIQQRMLEDATHAPYGPLAHAIQHVVGLAGELGLAQLFKELMGVRGHWARFPLPQTLERRIAAVYQRLGVDLETTETQVLAELVRIAADYRLRTIALAMQKGGVRGQDVAQRVLEALTAEDSVALLAALTDSSSEARTLKPDKQVQKAAPGVMALAEEFNDAFQAWFERYNAHFVASATASVITLAETFLQQYKAGKDAHGLLDYEDLIERTEALLTKERMAPWVLYKLDGGIDHILIDEAQDTSPAQWRIIGAIAEEFYAGLSRDPPSRAHRPRTVFAVGDLKQSIYSFQGADPGSFQQMRAHLQARAQHVDAPFSDVPLLRSFRSTAPVLEMVDKVFADAVARQGVATGDADQVIHQLSRVGEAGRVEIWPALEKSAQPKVDDAWLPLDTVTPDHPAVTLATDIATMIAGWLKAKTPLPSKGRPIEPGDILILVRRRNALTEELIRQLKRCGVPVSGADRLKLLGHMAVQDLMALGHFALNPRDDLTLGGLLKSPLIGLSEDDLFDLAHGRPGALWDALQSRAGETLIAQAHARLMAVLTRADKLPPFEFFAQELGPRGGRTRLLERLGPDANDPIDEFLNLALAFEQAHAPSLQSFLHWVMQGAAEIKRDLDKGAGVVRIMTIHGAKGLEGNIVILPDTGQTPPNRRAVLLKEDDGVFLWSINAKRDCLRREALVTAANDRERQEYHRLLYVALTRASEQLIVCGFKNARGQGYENSWHDLVTRAARGLPMQEIEAEHGTKLVYVKPQEKPVAAISGVMAERAAALPHWAQVQLHTLKRIPRTRPAASGGTQSTAARYGELVHLCLRRAEQPRQDLAALAAQFQLSADEVALALAEAARIRAEPALAHVFGSATRAEVAFDVLDEVAGARITGRFDRLAVTPEAATIFEFKTARNPPAAPGDVPDTIRRQLGLYARAATLIFPGRAVSAELIWTAKAHRMCLPSPLLEQWGRGP